MFCRHALLLFVGGMFFYAPLISSATTTLGISPEKVVKPVIATLDSSGDVGYYPSIAIGRDGNPVVAYFDNSTGNIKILKCNDASCSSRTIQDLDYTASAGVLSMVIGRDGFPVLSYYPSGHVLKFAKCNDASCTTSSQRGLDVSSFAGQYNAIAIGSDGYPVIAYCDGWNLDLKFAKCTDSTCLTPTINNLDSADSVGLHVSIAIGRDGNANIAYYKSSSQDLKFAQCNDSACSAPTIRTIDSTGIVGDYTSIAIGRDGYPVISYHDSTNNALKVAKCNDTSCSSVTIRTFYGIGVVGYYSSIAIGRDGYPVVSYYDFTFTDLYFLQCKDPSCATYAIRKVDSVGDVGKYSTIKVGRDGYPVISYYDLTNSNLKFAYIGNQVKINTTPPPSQKTAGGLVGWWTFDGKDVNWTTNKVIDRSGLGNHGAIINMATSSAGKPGKIGQGFRFQASPTVDYVNAGSVASFDDMNNITLSLWVYKKTNGIQTLMQKADSSTPISARGWNLQAGPLQVLFNVGTSDFSLNKVSTMQSINNGWHHIAVTWTGGIAKTSATIYLDGVDVSWDIVSSDGSGVRGSDGTLDLAIGGYSGQSANHLDGTLDDVRIYNRILTAQEIRDLYNQTKGSTVGKCGAGPVLDADGNKYSIVQIGTQCWLDRNMNVGTRINGGVAQLDNAVIEKYCYDDTDSNCTINHPKRPDGGLYQWNEAMQYSTTEGARGICPAGWHIPTDREWYTLENFLKGSGQTCNASRSGLNDCFPSGMRLQSNGNALFEANLKGFSNGGLFFSRDSVGYFWSSSPSGGLAWYRRVSSGSASVYRDTYSKSYSFSVRCIKN